MKNKIMRYLLVNFTYYWDVFFTLLDIAQLNIYVKLTTYLDTIPVINTIDTKKQEDYSSWEDIK